MTTEQPKSAPTPEQPYPVPVPYPHGFNGAPYPPHGPPGGYGPFYSYPPPDANSAENGQNAPPGYMMFHHPPPPGMVFTYPPPQNTGYSPPQNAQVPSALSRPKRKQVKMACTNCAAACKRCDENRPCERCMKYGVADTCVDGQRKERKKGIKRGPYKRKNKLGSSDSPPFGESSAEGDWPSGGPPAATPATTAAAIQAVTHQFPNGEGFYPMYYPPHGPGPYLPPPPPPHDGQPGPDGSPPHPNGAPPTVPYFIHGGYPPFGHYPPFMHGAPPLPHAPLPPAQPQPPQTVDPAATSASKVTETTNGNHAAPSVENGTGKKRTRASKGGGEPKMKKVKHSAKASKEDEGVVEDGGAEGD